MSGQQRFGPTGQKASSDNAVNLRRSRYCAANAGFLARLSPSALACWPVIAKQIRNTGALDTVDCSTLVEYCEAYARWLAAGDELAKLLVQLGRSSCQMAESPPANPVTQKPDAITQPSPAVPKVDRMPNSIMRLHEVTAAIGLSRSTIYKRVRDGTFPAPIQLGAKSVGWRFGDIEAFLLSPSCYGRRRE